MNVFERFDKIPSMILQDIKETKRYGHTFVRSDGWTDGRENSIPSHKHSFWGWGGGINISKHVTLTEIQREPHQKYCLGTVCNLKLLGGLNRFNKIPT